MIIAQISDTHITVDLPEGARRLEDLRRTVTTINALDPQPDVVIHTGDLVNRGKAAEYAAARSALDALRAPFFPVPGNRDDREGLRAHFVQRSCIDDGAPYVQYVVDEYAVRLVGIDTQSDRSQKGDFCEARAAALARTLAAQPERPTALFMHHPPFEVEGDPCSFQYETRQGLARVLETLGRGAPVIRVFCGHAHQAREADLGGVLASTVSSIAVDLRQGRDDPLRHTGPPRFQLHRFTPSQGFRTENVETGRG
jgi:3',5'-cyclic-AMP phosphodiesterase